MSLETLVEEYKELGRQIEEMERKKKEINRAIFEQMNQKSIPVGKYIVKKYERVLIKTTIEDARMFSATKMEEVVDKDKVKAIYMSGELIPGVSKMQGIQVYTCKKDVAEEAGNIDGMLKN